MDNTIPKKIIYIANVRMPTEKAHGVQIAKMCEALSQLGAVVHLLVPKRVNSITESIFSYYRIPESFSVTYVPVWDLVGRVKRFGFLFVSIIFSFRVLYNIKKMRYKGIIFSRDQFSLWLLTFVNSHFHLFYEIHTHNIPKKTLLYRRILKRVRFIVTNMHIKSQIGTLGVPEDRILIAPNGVDLDMFTSITSSKKELRERLHLPIDKTIILYSGHLYQWKGVDTLVRASQFLHDSLIYIVGGTDEDIKNFKHKLEHLTIQNVVIVGRKPYHEIAYYLKSADILVLPNTSTDEASRLYTSPIKMFEYMASNIPIIAAAVPSNKEILNEHNCVLYTPDSAEDLVEKISYAISNMSVVRALASQAFADVQYFTWDTRAKKIIEFIYRDSL